MGRSPKALEIGLINSFLMDNSAERLEHLQMGEFIENRQSNKETATQFREDLTVTHVKVLEEWRKVDGLEIHFECLNCEN